MSTGPGGELEKLNEMLKTAGAQRRLFHPEGTVAEIHPATSLGKENPQRVMEEKADEACLFLLLGQKGTTTSQAGKLGDDETHENVKEERKLGLANWLARNPLRQFARAVLIKNYGNADECPELAPDTTKPLKPEQVGQLMTAVSSSRVPIRSDEFYKKIGFTQPESGEVVISAGTLSIQGDALTDEEKFNQDLQKQVAQGEAQLSLQAEAQGSQPDTKDQQDKPDDKAKASGRLPAHTVKHVIRGGERGAMELRNVLRAATDAELAELEDKLTAAEGAPEHNGEAHAVEDAVAALENRIKFP